MQQACHLNIDLEKTSGGCAPSRDMNAGMNDRLAPAKCWSSCAGA
jgi:hypothetical protein